MRRFAHPQLANHICKNVYNDLCLLLHSETVVVAVTHCLFCIAAAVADISSQKVNNNRPADLTALLTDRQTVRPAGTFCCSAALLGCQRPQSSVVRCCPVNCLTDPIEISKHCPYRSPPVSPLSVCMFGAIFVTCIFGLFACVVVALIVQLLPFCRKWCLFYSFVAVVAIIAILVASAFASQPCNHGNSQPLSRPVSLSAAIKLSRISTRIRRVAH